MLALAEVEDGHDGGLFVLRGVPLEDLDNDGFVGGGEFEGDVGVVVGGVAVLLLWEAGERLACCSFSLSLDSGLVY